VNSSDPVFGVKYRACVLLPAGDSHSAGTIHLPANSFPIIDNEEEYKMIKRLVVAAVAVAGISFAMPAGAEEIGVGVGPVGVTVGSGHPDGWRDRDREVIRERDHRDRDNTVVIRKGDRDRDFDHDRKTVIIDRDR
jgi:hypothetical protein